MIEWRLEPHPDGPAVTFEWRVAEGDRVKAGDIIAIASSDEAEQELEAFEAGAIVRIVKTNRGYVLIVDEGTQG